MAKKANINPEILRWARKTARISLEKAASTISKTCKPERIKEWESPEGNDKPSERQVEKLARLYRRPKEVFYFQNIPKDFPPLKDFRKDKEEYNTGLIFMMREIQEKQEWLSEFLASKKERKLDFIGRFNIKSPVESVAADIRKTLGINSRTALKPIKHWIEQAEAKRIFICLSSNYHTRLKLDSDFFKGFAIADKFAPFIFVNSEDWEHGQLVTLVHELAHLWIGVSGVSNDTEISATSRPGLHPVERFCNEVAAAALLPAEELSAFLPGPEKTEFKNVAKAARKLGVSNAIVINRSKNLGLLNEEKVNGFRKEAGRLWKEYLIKESKKKKSSGGPNYYVMQLRRSSKAFSNVVMDNYKRGRISGEDASRLLKVREANFVKFEKYIYK